MGPGAQNGVVGDQSFGMDLPETVVPENDLTAERKAAKFSRTAEFRQLKERMEARILYYQHMLPGGIPVKDAQTKHTTAELGEMWVVAARSIDELQGVLDFYESAAEAVKGV